MQLSNSNHTTSYRYFKVAGTIWNDLTTFDFNNSKLEYREDRSDFIVEGYFNADNLKDGNTYELLVRIPGLRPALGGIRIIDARSEQATMDGLIYHSSIRFEIARHFESAVDIDRLLCQRQPTP